MESSYTVEISSALPFSEVQYNGLMQIVDCMDDRYFALEIKIPNHTEFDEFMAMYLEQLNGRCHAELDYAMDDFGWKYPLVLAADLDRGETAQLLRELLVDASGSGENEMVLNRFRQVPAARYGEEIPTVYERDDAAEYGEENADDRGTD